MIGFERRRRIALVLWITWAVVAWNVIFDHTIEVAGRAYLHAAALAAQADGPYARIDDWMRPAARVALSTASAAAAVILAVGIIAVRVASGRSTERASG